MNFRLPLGAAALAGVALLSTSFVGPAQEGGAPSGGGMDMKLMMELMALGQPGPEHEELAQRVGEWDVEMSAFMAPGATPMVSRAKADSRMVLGGRFLATTVEGSMMGLPTESLGYVGFDRRRGVYTTLGLDTMGTYWVTGEGVRDDDGVMRLHGVDDGGRFGEQVYTFEIEDVGPDEYHVRVNFHKQGPATYDPPFTMVSLRYTRSAEQAAGEGN